MAKKLYVVMVDATGDFKRDTVERHNGDTTHTEYGCTYLSRRNTSRNTQMVSIEILRCAYYRLLK